MEIGLQAQSGPNINGIIRVIIKEQEVRIREAVVVEAEVKRGPNIVGP